MADKLKGLFGGGSNPDEDVKKGLENFSQRFVDLDGDGIPDEEVKANFDTVMQKASPEQLKKATAQTLSHLKPQQRDELAKMLQQRQAGTGMVDIQRTGEVTTATAAGTAGGAAGGGGLDDLIGGLTGGNVDFDDILGGLFGQGGDGGSAGSINDVLGGLLGGGGQSNPGATADGGGGLGDILSGPLGKAIMGGIAAYAAKEIFGNKG